MGVKFRPPMPLAFSSFKKFVNSEVDLFSHPILAPLLWDIMDFPKYLTNTIELNDFI
jgi:hypothetical protein